MRRDSRPVHTSRSSDPPLSCPYLFTHPFVPRDIELHIYLSTKTISAPKHMYEDSGPSSGGGAALHTARSRSISRASGRRIKRRQDDTGSISGAGPGSSPLIIGLARRTLGIVLLLVVVVLWTASNFLASTIFADNTYSKPFFVTYLNTAFFIFPLLPIVGRRLFRLWRAGKLSKVTSLRSLVAQLDSREAADESRPFLAADDEVDVDPESDGRTLAEGNNAGDSSSSERLGFRETAKLSLEFCLLWFLANYFAMACLQFTTVGSTTILTSTSGVWTLIFGVIMGVEKFTPRKLIGVLASLSGIFLISRVDLSGSNDADNDANATHSSFPHKTTGEIALGDAMAAFSAILYGVYTIVMKKQVGNESRVNMSLFFGLVGLINTVIMWPGLVILHLAGWETFALPDSQRVWMIVLVNSVTSVVSDICWAYAMLLTTPLVVTVGLSLTIPLSLVAQIFLQGQYSSALYWVGATIVFFSFLVVNHEGKEG
ncbi:hypothetical protein FQN51_006670 [Onygenales sp. PD_10]|nr:hypothetical protein FQN51_006670 [Onygenales sp. PD_10]